MSAPALTHPVAAGPDPSRYKALAVLLLVQFMLILDATVVNIALPNMQTDLHVSRSGLTWIVDGYVLTAGALLLLGGRLSDLYGRRGLFLSGVVVFGLASVSSGLAQNSATLVVSRFVQGAGEALAAPAALGLIVLLFTDPKERTKAIGYFGGVSGAAGTLGPILSGAVVAYASWRWIFLLNIPIALAALVLVPRLVHARQGASQEARESSLDLVGAVLATAGLTGVTYGFVRAANHPWGSGGVLVPLLSGTVVFAAFVLYERRTNDPLIPLRFFAERTRAAANVTSAFFFAVFLGQFYFITLFLQQVRHFSAIRTGLAYLPFGISVGAAIGMATALTPKLGVRKVLTAGLAVCAVGAALYTRITPGGGYASHVLPAMVVLAFGSGLTLPTLGIAAVHRVTERDAGLASGIQQSVQQIGGAIGLAVLATIALRHGTGSPADVTGGYVLALRVGAGLLVVAAVLSVVLLPAETPQDRTWNHDNSDADLDAQPADAPPAVAAMPTTMSSPR